MDRLNLKGEVGFTAGDAAWTMVFSANALCVLEETFGIGVNDISGLMKEAPGMVLFRKLFFAGLADYHPEVTLLGAGRLISQYGINESGELIGQALTAAFGDGGDGKPAARPREGAGAKGPARAGTSPASTAPGAS